MTNLLWPGDQRAGELMTDTALLRAMVAVESAWLSALAGAGIAPAECADTDLAGVVEPRDAQMLASAAEAGANPVIGLVALLRERIGGVAGRWVHRGLTSQDVLDTAVMCAVRAAADQLAAIVAGQIAALSRLAATHRRTAMVARTLTQHAVPTTFGAKAAGWLDGVVAADARLAALITPVQIGGAGGTRAAAVELARLTGCTDDPVAVAGRVIDDVATRLRLAPSGPWHTTRAPVTAVGDALVGCTDAWGRIATDVVTLHRPEIGELSEDPAAGRGGSSTMPDKRNPVLSILIRRAAVAAPPLAATLHTAAALAGDERPDGAWHVEADTLRILVRRTVIAGSQCAELLDGLVVHTDRMAANLTGAQVGGEQRAIADFVGTAPSATYFGTIEELVDQSLQRARRALEGRGR